MICYAKATHREATQRKAKEEKCKEKRRKCLDENGGGIAKLRIAKNSKGMVRRGAAMELSSAAKKCMRRSIKNAPSGVADRAGRRNKS